MSSDVISQDKHGNPATVTAGIGLSRVLRSHYNNGLDSSSEDHFSASGLDIGVSVSKRRAIGAGSEMEWRVATAVTDAVEFSVDELMDLDSTVRLGASWALTVGDRKPWSRSVRLLAAYSLMKAFEEGDLRREWEQ